MNNPKRNYNNLTEDEKHEWTTLQEKEIVLINGQPSKLRKSYYRDYPKAVRHYLSIFPNHFLDAVDLAVEKDTLSDLVFEFEALLWQNTITERDILNFIKDKNAYFLIGSILKTCYRFGHHALFIIPEFQLTINHKVDFLLIGKNSHGHHFVFVECENPYGSITNKDGSYGKTIRKGIKQIDDWEAWIERNYSHLKPVFDRIKNTAIQLPDEFFELDKTRIHYVIISGKRNDFTSYTNRLNRTNLEQRKLLVLHYDNIVEYAKETIGSATY